MTWPVRIAFGSRISLMIAMAVTLLPEPDSPTMPTISRGLTVNETPSTARTKPSSVRNETWRSRTSRSGGAGGSGNPHAGVEPRIQDVDDRVREHDEERCVHDRGDDDRKIEVLERLIGEEPDPWQAEHDLCQQRPAADERSEVE